MKLKYIYICVCVINISCRLDIHASYDSYALSYVHCLHICAEIAWLKGLKGSLTTINLNMNSHHGIIT